MSTSETTNNQRELGILSPKHCQLTQQTSPSASLSPGHRLFKRPVSQSNFFTAILAAVFVAVVPAQAAIIFTDGFEGSKLFVDPAGYSYLASIDSVNAQTGSYCLLLNNKEGVRYTLTDQYQVGTYTVTYYARRDTLYAHNYSFLTYDHTSGYASQLASAYVEEPSLPLGAYTPITFTATIDAGSPAIGKNIQLLIEQSRLWNADDFYKLRVDDLTIAYTAVPEPSISIMGFLGAAMLFRRKR